MEGRVKETYPGFNLDTNKDGIFDKYGKFIDLSDKEGQTIELGAYLHLRNAKNGKISALQQPNVFCFEHGMPLGEDVNMRVGEKLAVENDMLNYILGQVPSLYDIADNANAEYYLERHSSNPIQQALWHFLYLAGLNTNQENSEYVLGENDKTLLDKFYNVEDTEQDEYNNRSEGLKNGMDRSGAEIFDEAEKYVALLKNFKEEKAKLNLTVDYKNNNLIIEVIGSGFEKFDLKIGQTYSQNSIEHNQNKTTLTIGLDQIKERQINVTIIPHFRKYQSYFRILSANKDDKQRILVASNEEIDLQGEAVQETIQLEYEVSLEKFVSHVNGTGINENRQGKAEYLTPTASGVGYVDNTKQDSRWTQHNWEKYNNVVTVKQGDYVTYTIIVYNDGKTPVKISEITDYLPEGISLYKSGDYSSNDSDYTQRPQNGIITITRQGVKELQPGESTKVTITVKVSESNMSLRVLKNTAEITELRDENGNEVTDSTPNNNKDSDYIQMPNLIISGMVWNDKAFNKGQNIYNGKYDDGTQDKEIVEQKFKENVMVYLYRSDKQEPIASTQINENGEYQFEIEKGPKGTNTNRWAGTYYSYYVVFEYDGVTYTSTVFYEDAKKEHPEYSTNDLSYAREKIEDRTNFNNQFATINNQGATGKNNKTNTIEYDTINESGIMAQSRFKYDPSFMNMTSSTNLINLSEMSEEQLKHINLGLRGREILDLQLETDIYATKVTVNNVEGAYRYNNNKVTIRKSDLNVTEDAANLANKTIESSVSDVKQDIRKTDIQNKHYTNTGLEVEVTYRMTVRNISTTDGAVTKVTNYYDDRYDFIRAYYLNGNSEKALNTTDGSQKDGYYKSVTVTVPEMYLEHNESVDIYVVCKLRNAREVLGDLIKNNGVSSIPTFNMGEIEEYKTKCAKEQTEFTRGLIDCNSAPGSANVEKARLQDATISPDRTTVDDYFIKAKGETLTGVMPPKCEDDTSISPILYFSSSDNQRTINGTVFHDKTTTDATTRIKTGNGKLDNNEVGVYGATVELIELVGDGIVRDTVTTDKDGKYTFIGFLPGNYMIRYHYGDTTKTLLLNQADTDINKYSYNGSDYQATNNTGNYGAAGLNSTKDYWYVYNQNEGVSTATDDAERRKVVDKNVTEFTTEKMTAFNNIKEMVGNYSESQDKFTATKQYNANRTQLQDIASIEITGIRDIIEKTKMNAQTPSLRITVEKMEVVNGQLTQRAEFGEYVVGNMNFGIAETPITVLNLQKEVKELILTDSVGQNTIIHAIKGADNSWNVVGDIYTLPDALDASVEDEKLQGAKLKITYSVSANTIVENNFNGGSTGSARITGIVDFINNNLSFNPDLEENGKYWEATSYQDLLAAFGNGRKGTVDPEGNIYTVIVKATSANPLLSGNGTASITLEKELSSSNPSFEEIITSAVESNVYNNIVEITGLSESRVETPDGYIIIPGAQHDTAEAEVVTIHQPTGDSSVHTMYYVIAAISLVILAAGVFGIKKFVLKK